MNSAGRSVQHVETSTIDCEARKWGGDVILAKSLLTVARNYIASSKILSYSCCFVISTLEDLRIFGIFFVSLPTRSRWISVCRPCFRDHFADLWDEEVLGQVVSDSNWRFTKWSAEIIESCPNTGRLAGRINHDKRSPGFNKRPYFRRGTAQPLLL